jgi:hypothetical protein
MTADTRDDEVAYLQGRADAEDGVPIDSHRARRWAHSSVLLDMYRAGWCQGDSDRRSED